VRTRPAYGEGVSQTGYSLTRPASRLRRKVEDAQRSPSGGRDRVANAQVERPPAASPARRLDRQVDQDVSPAVEHLEPEAAPRRRRRCPSRDRARRASSEDGDGADHGNRRGRTGGPPAAAPDSGPTSVLCSAVVLICSASHHPRQGSARAFSCRRAARPGARRRSEVVRELVAKRFLDAVDQRPWTTPAAFERAAIEGDDTGDRGVVRPECGPGHAAVEAVQPRAPTVASSPGCLVGHDDRDRGRAGRGTGRGVARSPLQAPRRTLARRIVDRGPVVLEIVHG